MAASHLVMVKWLRSSKQLRMDYRGEQRSIILFAKWRKIVLYVPVPYHVSGIISESNIIMVICSKILLAVPLAILSTVWKEALFI